MAPGPRRVPGHRASPLSRRLPLPTTTPSPTIEPSATHTAASRGACEPMMHLFRHTRGPPRPPPPPVADDRAVGDPHVRLQGGLRAYDAFVQEAAAPHSHAIPQDRLDRG